MKKFLKGFIVTLVALSMMVLVYGCSSGEKAQVKDQSEPKAAEKVKLLIGSETAYPPFEFQDEKTGKYEGFDMDLIRAIGEEAGFEIEIKSMNFDGVLGSVESGNVDAAISAITITPERAEKFNFSDPYFDADQSIAVRADDSSINSEADLVGKKIAVQIGTTGAALAKEVKDAQVKEFNSIGDAFMELRNGGADAVVNDIPVTADYLKKTDTGLRLVGVIKTGEQYGIGIAKGNDDTVAKINAALKTLKENGEYEKIYQKWFAEAK